MAQIVIWSVGWFVARLGSDCVCTVDPPPFPELSRTCLKTGDTFQHQLVLPQNSAEDNLYDIVFTTFVAGENSVCPTLLLQHLAKMSEPAE